MSDVRSVETAADALEFIDDYLEAVGHAENKVDRLFPPV
jgi:hypothetical protein